MSLQITYSKNTVQPLPKAFTAKPVSVISDRSTSITYAISAEINTPTRIAASKPTAALCVHALVTTPARAENSMMPSRPMLTTPAREVIIAPNAASKMGVVTRKIE